MGPRRLGSHTGRSPHRQTPMSFLQPAHGDGRELCQCKAGNSGPSRSLASVRGSVFPRLGVSASTSRMNSSRRAHSSSTTLADGRSAHGCSGNGTCRRRSPPPSLTPLSPPGGWHAEYHHHTEAGRGDRPSAAISPEGGPRATRAGGHLATNGQEFCVSFCLTFSVTIRSICSPNSVLNSLSDHNGVARPIFSVVGISLAFILTIL